MIELTAEDIAAIRDYIQARSNRVPRDAPRYARKLVGGPLDGIIEWTDKSDTPTYLGFPYQRRDGLIQAMYKHESGRVWKFEEVTTTWK